ncbi:MAG: hypothetical protein HZB41_13730 [Ignavibacteriae bacterium]|nr:hypothetical protein [Ignavibacteriota bacterium]
MKKLMNIFMLSCKKATELIEKELSIKLTKTEKFKLHFHVSMCNACRTYKKQSKIIDEALQYHFNEHHTHQSEYISEDFKNIIIKNLKK